MKALNQVSIGYPDKDFIEVIERVCSNKMRSTDDYSSEMHEGVTTLTYFNKKDLRKDLRSLKSVLTVMGASLKQEDGKSWGGGLYVYSSIKENQ